MEPRTYSSIPKEYHAGRTEPDHPPPDREETLSEVAERTAAALGRCHLAIDRIRGRMFGEGESVPDGLPTAKGHTPVQAQLYENLAAAEALAHKLTGVAERVGGA